MSESVPSQSAIEAERLRRAEEAGEDYEIGLVSLSQWQLAWRKFRGHRLALVGLAIIATLVILARSTAHVMSVSDLKARLRTAGSPMETSSRAA